MESCHQVNLPWFKATGQKLMICASVPLGQESINQVNAASAIVKTTKVTTSQQKLLRSRSLDQLPLLQNICVESNHRLRQPQEK